MPHQERRSLSASRRSFIAFSGGSAALESRDSFRMSAIGNVDFWYEFKQSWIGAVRYHRGITFIDEVVDPLLSDAIAKGLMSVDYSYRSLPSLHRSNDSR